MGKKLQILVLEDDHLQARDLRHELEKVFDAEVRVISTEHEFRQVLPEIAEAPPRVAVLDRMVRWADPAPDMPLPPQEDWDPEEAGLRCAELLEGDERTRSAKILLFSVLGDGGNINGFECFVKESEFGNLTERIKDFIQEQGPA